MAVAPAAAAAPAATVAPYERILTLEDYLDLPLDKDAGVEQEIIHGRLVTVARPNLLHQMLLINLAELFRRYVRRRKWHVIQVVMDADLLMDALNSYVSPDLMLFLPQAAPALLDLAARRRRVHLFNARPVLVVEILSPDSKTSDLVDKRQDYEAAGIPHYWAFDLYLRVMHEFVLDEQTGRYEHLTHTARRVRPQLFAGDRPSLALDLERLWPPGA